MKQTSPIRSKRPSEEGYILVAVVFMMAILILSLAVAIPKVREDIQRDRDEETMQRGKQYIRAIQLYYRKFHAYPPNLDALTKTNDIRFLRKKYVDPTTGKEDWKPIMWGQNKTPMAMGFFGQPLAAATGGGIGPSGNNLTGTGSSTAGSSLFNPGSSVGSSATGTTGTTDQGGAGALAGGTGGTDASGTQGGGTGSPGSTGTSSAIGSSSNPAGSGQTFGGGGIIGFSPQSPKQSILVYKKKNHYNEWEFLYSFLTDQQQQMTGGNTGLVGQPASSTTTPIGGGTNSTAPTTPTGPPSPTAPQQ